MIAASNAFPMYDFPEVAAAHDRFWRTIVAHARNAGFAGDVPLVQVCGYPLVKALSKRFEALAVPAYTFAFSAAATHHSAIVVGASSHYSSVAQLRGTRFAMNAPDSNTGMNLPRRLFAEYARAGRFFETVVETGSHAQSLEAVASGDADVASIDTVTFGLLARIRPIAVAGVRIIALTAPSPAPPMVVPHGTSSRDRTALLAALSATIADQQLAAVREELGLAGFHPAQPDAFDVLARYENDAAALGYAVLA